ncbi:MAG: DUF1700 domain-containing protein [Eubacteriales bacterium]|nr:DUF1700 domain-containing protein [Eubacteriales bacterium]
MSKAEYLDRLAWLLSDIPEGEREEALTYYRDYFEDAGERSEEEVIATLGSPEKVAAMIREGISGADPLAGAYTEQGYVDERYREDNKVPDTYRQPAARSSGQSSDRSSSQFTGRNSDQFTDGNSDQFTGRNSDRFTDGNSGQFSGRSYGPSADGQKEFQYQKTDGERRNAFYGAYSQRGNSGDTWQSERKPRKKRRNVWLIVLLCIVLLPAGLPILATVLGLIVGLAAALIGILIAIGVGSITALVAGISLLGAGLAKIFLAPATGFLYSGIGFLAMGIGVILFVLTGWIIRRVLPGLVRWFVRLCQKPFRRGGRYS